MSHSLILDIADYILNEDYSLEFKEEYGIIDINNLGPSYVGGFFEMEIFFNKEESKKRFIKDIDIDEIIE